MHGDVLLAAADDVFARDDTDHARAALDDEEVPEALGAKHPGHARQRRVLQRHLRGFVDKAAEIHEEVQLGLCQADLVHGHIVKPRPQEVVHLGVRRGA